MLRSTHKGQNLFFWELISTGRRTSSIWQFGSGSLGGVKVRWSWNGSRNVWLQRRWQLRISDGLPSHGYGIRYMKKYALAMEEGMPWRTSCSSWPIARTRAWIWSGNGHGQCWKPCAPHPVLWPKLFELVGLWPHGLSRPKDYLAVPWLVWYTLKKMHWGVDEFRANARASVWAVFPQFTEHLLI